MTLRPRAAKALLASIAEASDPVVLDWAAEPVLVPLPLPLSLPLPLEDPEEDEPVASAIPVVIGVPVRTGSGFSSFFLGSVEEIQRS